MTGERTERVTACSPRERAMSRDSRRAAAFRAQRATRGTPQCIVGRTLAGAGACANGVQLSESCGLLAWVRLEAPDGRGFGYTRIGVRRAMMIGTESVGPATPEGKAGGGRLAGQAGHVTGLARAAHGAPPAPIPNACSRAPAAWPRGGSGQSAPVASALTSGGRARARSPCIAAAAASSASRGRGTCCRMTHSGRRAC